MKTTSVAGFDYQYKILYAAIAKLQPRWTSNKEIYKIENVLNSIKFKR